VEVLADNQWLNVSAVTYYVFTSWQMHQLSQTAPSRTRRCWAAVGGNPERTRQLDLTLTEDEEEELNQS